MVRQLLRWQEIDQWIAWLDAPGAFTLARGLAPRLVVYDCSRRSLPAGPDAGPSEAQLLRAADLLFLGDAEEPPCWDGLAGHMLGELSRAERGGLPPLRVAQAEAAPDAYPGGGRPPQAWLSGPARKPCAGTPRAKPASLAIRSGEEALRGDSAGEARKPGYPGRFSRSFTCFANT
jgi:hypothetical protein